LNPVYPVQPVKILPKMQRFWQQHCSAASRNQSTESELKNGHGEFVICYLGNRF
jgi:hypothetical protein